MPSSPEAPAKILGTRVVRCAIYARKSTEEGLSQPFNSLDAQRESAEAYILSQRHMGWAALERRYEDGGYTGANLERPALRTLTEDIESGQVDCVVVYKVDRLSRSLLDFARLIGMFEEHGVSLVSVTQQLNTTDSLGRLTLNILLSFAQFERELIAERTRDKMRAARRKGKWLGGQPILGYDVDPECGGLKINAGEATRVGFIFQQIAEGKSTQEVLAGLSQRGWSTKQWVSRSGREHSGRAFKESDLVRLVQNVMYLGKLRDGDQIYQAHHAGIVERDLWERASAAVKRWRTSAREARPKRSQSSTTDTESQGAGPASVPRIRRLLALALKMEQMIREGTVKNYAALAQLGQVSRARITQVMNPLQLAPDIQEEILLGNTAETGRDRDKKVACHDHLGVVADEGEPSLLRIWFSSGASILQVFPNRSGRNPDAEFEFQFVGDAFLAPSRILGGHLSDQLPEVLGQAGSSDWLGLPAPEQSKSFAVPTDERIRLHVHQRIAPREYSAQGRHHQPSGVVGASRFNLSLLEQRQLFPEEEILRGQCAVGTRREGSQSDHVAHDRRECPEQCPTARKISELAMNAQDRTLRNVTSSRFKLAYSFCGGQVLEAAGQVDLEQLMHDSTKIQAKGSPSSWKLAQSGRNRDRHILAAMPRYQKSPTSRASTKPRLESSDGSPPH